MTLDNPVYPFFILFSRVGGCLMTAPGFSSDRVPVQFRLYMAGAVTLAIAPAILEKQQQALAALEPHQVLVTILAELAVGVTVGLLARYYFLALETLSTALAMTFGLGNIFGAALTEQEPTPSLSSFVMLGALMLVFCADLHLELVRALFLSYDSTPLFTTPSAGAFLDEVARILTQAHLLALRIYCSRSTRSPHAASPNLLRFRSSRYFPGGLGFLDLWLGFLLGLRLPLWRLGYKGLK